MMMGISYSEFWSMNPRIIKFCVEQYKAKRNEEDLKQWQLGQYILAAVSCISPKGKYPKKPMFQIEEDIKKNGNKESQEEIAIFEMKQRIKALRMQGLPESPV